MHHVLNERTLTHLGVRDGGDAGDDCSIDLRDATWMTPALMAGTAAQALRARLAGRPFTLLGPRTRDQAYYAARMRLGAVLDDLGADHALPTVREKDLRGHLLELTPLHGEEQLRELTGLVHDKLAADDPGLAAAMHQGLSEVGSNVSDHSGTTGFIVAQTMPSLGELRLAVADSGHGLLTTLRARGVRTHGDALSRALDGLSRHAHDPERGNGLRRTLRLVTLMSGTVYLATGDSWVIDNGRSRTGRRALSPYQGVLFEANIPLAGGRHARRPPT